MKSAFFCVDPRPNPIRAPYYGCVITRFQMSTLIPHLLQGSRQLRWRLTLSYALVTVGALLVVEVLVLLALSGYFAYNSDLAPDRLMETFEGYVQMAQPSLSQVPPDTGGLQRLLTRFRGNMIGSRPIKFGNMFIYVEWFNAVNVYFTLPDGSLVGSLPSDTGLGLEPGETLDLATFPGLSEPWQAALAGETEPERLFDQQSRYSYVGAVPIFSENKPGRVVGVLVFTTRPFFSQLWPLSQIGLEFGYSLLFITLFAAGLGTIFGAWTARGLVRRLRRLSSSARAWSGGDFSIYVDDSNGDEVSALAQDLNRMARQLERLIDERQAMSAVEERNRLARDLHDSVKQQAFAASAQLAAAQAKMALSPENAQQHLDEADRLIHTVRQELTHLIQELHPAALRGKGLATELRDYALEWSQQNDIPVEVRVQGERPLPLETEQSLYRIIQGALSNVARHSQARHAEISLIYQPDCLTLTIADDGVGFDAARRRFGLGLRSIRERAEQLQGELHIDSGPGQGTRLTVACQA